MRPAAALRRCLALALVLGACGAPAAGAHPLGNFSVNRLAVVSVSEDAIDVRYVVDKAEIPTFQDRGIGDGAVLARTRRAVARGLTLRVDGRAVALAALAAGRISHPAGQAGLALTRVELALRARLAAPPRDVVLRDATFAGRVGWKAIVARAGRKTAVRSSVPSFDPTRGLRAYPPDALSSPLDQRAATFAVAPGDGSLLAPRSPFERAPAAARPAQGFAGLLERAAAGQGVLLVLLLAAFGWGAIHALSPGHGKTMVAAYLVGTRGTARHAVALGAITTLTHTAGVFALALVTLALSQYVLPEQLYPWLALASGVLVVGIGIAVLRSRARRTGRHGAHHHRHGHAHDHGHRHADEHGRHERADHRHSHDHQPPTRLSWRGLVAMGASAGLIPCPSALVVLLGAISQHEIALGMLLVAAFSFGLAATLTALGLLVVLASRATRRLDGPLTGRLAGALPAVSALVIVAAGTLLTVRAIPGVLET